MTNNDDRHSIIESARGLLRPMMHALMMGSLQCARWRRQRRVQLRFN
jgi:hypothetical protein